MFTGIIQAIGTIKTAQPIKPDDPQSGLRLQIEAGELDLSDVVLGDSIAINGACMTVIAATPNSFTVDVSQESLSKTCGLSEPGVVNLEKALTLQDRLGGHLVSGHVDGLGKVVSFMPVGESWQLKIMAPLALAKYLAYKGSVVINGVSLTVNKVEDTSQGCEIEINLIPHTLMVTTLNKLRSGDQVNMEIDLIARYCERMLGLQSQ